MSMFLGTVVRAARFTRLGREAPADLEDVGLAEQYKACPLDPAREVAVARRAQLTQVAARLRDWQALPRGEHVLQQEWHAEEWRVASRCLRGLAREIVGPVDDCVQARIETLDQRNRELDEFRGCDLPVLHPFGKSNRRDAYSLMR